MSQCIFCKISNKEIPGHIIFENEHIIAFLDISQATKGHTLVMPKNHIEDVFSMTAEDMATVFSVVPKIANALKTTFNADGMNIINNNKPVAGQTIFHYHVHLIPRYTHEDSFEIKSANNMSKFTPELLTTLKEEIVSNL